MRVAVLGGGNGAYAGAADLSAQGHEVRLWRRNADALAPVRDAGMITLKDAAGSRAVQIACVTGDIGEAVRGAEVIFMPDPAFTQPDNARRLAPHLADGRAVFLAPGTFGSYLMTKTLLESAGKVVVRAGFGPRYAAMGLYDWRGRDMAEYQRALVGRYVALFRHLGLLAPPGAPR